MQQFSSNRLSDVGVTNPCGWLKCFRISALRKETFDLGELPRVLRHLPEAFLTVSSWIIYASTPAPTQALTVQTTFPQCSCPSFRPSLKPKEVEQPIEPIASVYPTIGSQCISWMATPCPDETALATPTGLGVVRTSARTSMRTSAQTSARMAAQQGSAGARSERRRPRCTDDAPIIFLAP